MDIKNDFPELSKRLKEKYTRANEEDILDTIEFAVHEYIRLRRDFSITEASQLDLTWVKKACFEMLDRTLVLGIVGGVKQYSENGYQYTLDGVQISTALASEVLPKVGAPK